MRNLFVPVLFVLVLAGCGDKPAKEAIAASTNSDTVTNTSKDTLEQTDPQPTAINEGGLRLVPGAPKQVLTHIPEGYVIMDTCSGDLNLDSYTDLLLVLRLNNEDSLSRNGEEPKRRLLILTGSAEQTYTLATQSDNAVYCAACGGILGDPYQNMVIKSGYFSIEHYGGSRERWTRIPTFKYSPADSTWLLHKDGHESFDAVDEEAKKTTKVYTIKDFGKVTFADFDIYKY